MWRYPVWGSSGFGYQSVPGTENYRMGKHSVCASNSGQSRWLIVLAYLTCVSGFGSGFISLDHPLKKSLEIMSFLWCLFSFGAVIIGVISWDLQGRGENSGLQVSIQEILCSSMRGLLLQTELGALLPWQHMIVYIIACIPHLPDCLSPKHEYFEVRNCVPFSC